MELKPALAGQYHAGLAMLRQCIDRCPDDLWVSGSHPRTYWRIAYHAIFYTHLYLMPNLEAFKPWEKAIENDASLWDDDPDGVPPAEPVYTKEEMLGYLDQVDAQIDGWVEGLDLDALHTGFDWYPIPKLDHQLMNLRHVQGHLGQLSELMMARGIDIDWIAVPPNRKNLHLTS
ncbi:MAG TPA: DinB family protein [Fimbriimonadaceae bacterium]|nr:DinB family protein [Fimbriimonadaceae bacterium]